MPLITSASRRESITGRCRFPSCSQLPIPTVHLPLRRSSACSSWASWTRLGTRQVNGKWNISHYLFCSHLKEVANLVAKKLADIPRHTLIKFWHHSTYWLFKYLVFEEIWRLIFRIGLALPNKAVEILSMESHAFIWNQFLVSIFMNILIKYFCLIYSDWETLLLFYVCFYEYAFIICMNFSPCLNLKVNFWLISLL